MTVATVVMNMISFFILLKRYYRLDEDCKIGNCVDLFKTWNTAFGEITHYCDDTDTAADAHQYGAMPRVT